ncbi:MAG: pyrimidine 5'-nucleotidase [Anaerolineaceae bacterium]|nr:pyrimidine 5'-nucleotidase [Anaerolineaceae bacterium]
MTFSTLFVDLDDTVYPKSSGLWQAIRRRLDQYMLEQMHFPANEIPVLREHLFTTYGTTMRGLQALYHIDTQEYLAYVHDVPLGNFIQPDLATRAALHCLPQRKIIFTNADTNHARRVLDVLEIGDCFDQIIDINAMSPYCKPMTEAFQIALQAAGEKDATHCVMIDDLPRNLAAARRLGFYTIRVGSVEPSSQYHGGIEHLSDLGPAINL